MQLGTHSIEAATGPVLFGVVPLVVFVHTAAAGHLPCEAGLWVPRGCFPGQDRMPSSLGFWASNAPLSRTPLQHAPHARSFCRAMLCRVHMHAVPCPHACCGAHRWQGQVRVLGQCDAQTLRPPHTSSISAPCLAWPCAPCRARPLRASHTSHKLGAQSHAPHGALAISPSLHTPRSSWLGPGTTNPPARRPHLVARPDATMQDSSAGLARACRARSCQPKMTAVSIAWAFMRAKLPHEGPGYPRSRSWAACRRAHPGEGGGALVCEGGGAHSGAREHGCAP